MITGRYRDERLITDRAEQLYLFANTHQINAQTGFQGLLRGYFFEGGMIFNTKFFPYKEPYDDGFDNALQTVFDTLRRGILKSYTAMRKFCYGEGYAAKLDASLRSEDEFGIRIDYCGFAFLIRLIPRRGDYNIYCFCYRTDWLNQHLEKARNGIRFIDSTYQELFRLEDGGTIRYRNAAGEPIVSCCRYIDDYHVQIRENLYHICELAEALEARGCKAEPVRGRMENPEEKRRREVALKRRLINAPGSSTQLTDEDIKEILANKDGRFDELLAGKKKVAYVYSDRENLGAENRDNELRERDEEGNVTDEDESFGAFLLGTPGGDFFELESGKIIELEVAE